MRKTIRMTLAVSSTALLALNSSAALYTWDAGGGANNRYSTTANWDPTAPSGGPQSGDIGTVGGSYRVEVGTSTELTTGAAITFNSSSYLERNSTSGANMGGTYTFNDSTRMNVSALALQSGATLNWNSSGTFSNAPAGLSSAAMFDMLTGSTVNMSSGVWKLDSTGTDAFKVSGGTFNMTGGQIVAADRFRVDGTFNLGGSGAVFAASEFLTGTLNFQGKESAFYLLGLDKDFASTRYSGSNIRIDGVVQADNTGLNFENVNVGGVDYTKISVIPEPATIGMLGLGAVCAILLRKIRY